MENCLIVLNYNDYNTTKKFIENINLNRYIDKIIIVDNCSTDESYEKLLKLESDKIDIIKTNKNGGYASGNNYGMKYAVDKYKPKNFVISNPDVIFDEKIVNHIGEVLEKHEKVALATGIMLDTDGKETDSIAWKLPRYIDDLRNSFLLMEKFADNLKYKREYFNKEVVEVDVVPGSFFVIKANVMKEIGYLDEDTFLYCEERILAWKLKNNGYKASILGNERFVHAHSTTINKNIKSILGRYKILCDSKKVYLKKYVRCGCIKMWLFNAIVKFSYLEKIIYSYLNRLRS